MIVIDIDHFKRVNDTVGHAVGDTVLKDVAYIIRKDLRAFELAYRLGGEEFLILLPGGDADQSMQLATRLRDAVEATRFSHDLRDDDQLRSRRLAGRRPLQLRRPLRDGRRGHVRGEARGAATG